MKLDTGSDDTLLPHPDDMGKGRESNGEQAAGIPKSWLKPFKNMELVSTVGVSDVFETGFIDVEFAFPGYPWAFESICGFRAGPKKRSREANSILFERQRIPSGLLSLHDLLKFFDVSSGYDDFGNRTISIVHRKKPDGRYRGFMLERPPEYRRTH